MEDRLYILPVTARFMAPDDEAAGKVAQGIYNAGGAVRAHINAEGVACSNLLLNTRSEEVELVGGGYSEDALNEARTALINGGDLQNVNHAMIAETALHIQATREAAEHEHDWDTAAVQTVGGTEYGYYEILRLAEDTSEIYHSEVEPDSQGSIMDMLNEAIKGALLGAVRYQLTRDREAAAERLDNLETEATERGEEAAKAAASWTTDGSHDVAERARVLAMMRDGDPAADQYLPAEPNLSGEAADDPTPLSLARELTGEDDPSPEIMEAISDAFEAGVSDTFGPACEAELIKFTEPDASGS